MEEDSRQYTAFNTTGGHYQFKQMPLGLCNAPAVFQRLINFVLGVLRYDIAMAYIDDIIMPPKSIEQRMTKLVRVLGAFAMQD